MRPRPLRILIVLCLGAVLAIAALVQRSDTPSTTSTRPPSTSIGATDPPAAGTEATFLDHLAPGLADVTDPERRTAARQLIARVRVAEPLFDVDYDRDRFGGRWTDDTDSALGHNGCDTRNDILARDLPDETFRPGTHDCVVVTGTLTDPYTGTTIAFTKTDADAVQIDHIVSLAAAWRMGAHRWTDDQRQDFANDPLNLLAVDGPTNVAKGDDTPRDWFPPVARAACAFSERYAAVSLRYDLPVTAADRTAMTAACT